MTSIAAGDSDLPAATKQASSFDVLNGPVAQALALLASAAAYYFGARLGFAMRFPSSPYSILWPPNAIVLAAFLLLPTRLWWVCLLVAFPAHVLVEIPAGLSWPTTFGLFVTNTAQGLVAAALVRYFSGKYVDAGAHVTFFVFVACAVFAAPLLFSFGDAAVNLLTGRAHDYWGAWRLRFLSNAASTIIFVPPILCLAQAVRECRRPSLKRSAEALVLALCFATVGAIVIAESPVLTNTLPLLLASLLPLLLWGAIRFGKGGASCALLGLVLVTMGSLAHWPVESGGQEGILLLQAIFLLISIPVLYLATVHTDLRRSVHSQEVVTQRYRLATTAASVAVWDWNPRTGAMFLEPTLKRRLGYDDHEIANHIDAWMLHLHPDDGPRLQGLANACARGEPPAFEDEHRLLHRDGSIRWFLARGALVRDAGGRPLRVMGTCIDVTDRHRIADELHGLEVLSGAVLASLNEQVAIIDRGGVIVAANDAWIRFGSENAGATFDRAASGVDYVGVCRRTGAGADGPSAAQGITAVLGGSRADFHKEYVCVLPDGTHWFEMVVVPLRRPDGGAVVSHSDITRRRLAEIESERQRQELTHLTRVGILGALSGALAHELNQPLTAILSNAQAMQRFLAREPLDLVELGTALKDIVEADKRAGSVIQRLRALLKRGETLLRPLDLNKVVNEVLELAHSDLVARNVTTACRLAPDLPRVRSDRVQLQQVLLNLIVNACEAMTDTQPSERILTIVTEPGDRQSVQVCVSDRGGGIPADMLDGLFEPFITTKKHGLGLGLSICRSIVAAHGGRLWAVNDSGRGASFFVALPVSPEGTD